MPIWTDAGCITQRSCYFKDSKGKIGRMPSTSDVILKVEYRTGE